MIDQRIDGRVEFRFFRPGVRNAFLVGDFNGWSKTSLPMEPAADGWWTCRVRLRAGAYQFQYLADGKSYLDYAAFGLERNPWGTWNSVVMVGPEYATSRGIDPATAGMTTGAQGPDRQDPTWVATSPGHEAVSVAGENGRSRQLQKA